MNVIEKIKALLKEAELYHSMGLLNEAMGKYQNASALIQSNAQLKSRTNLVDGISKKIRALEKDIRKVAEASDSPEVSEKVQDLIKKLFTFSAGDDHDTAALDGAMALAKFGQHERALLEFNELLKKDSVRVVAAKNIIRCHLTHTSADAAVDQYERWISSDIFRPGELNKLRIFLEGLLKKEGIDKQVPGAEAPLVTQEPTIAAPEIKEPKIEGLKLEVNEVRDDEVIDINSVGITLADGPKKGQMVELTVSFQSGNVISLLISHADKDLIKLFNQGDTLKDVQFYSPIAMFEGSAIVSAKNQIESGPRRGDYSIDLKVVST
jgi:tetratricopeptide (TPR) repeat protein